MWYLQTECLITQAAYPYFFVRYVFQMTTLRIQVHTASGFLEGSLGSL